MVTTAHIVGPIGNGSPILRRAIGQSVVERKLGKNVRGLSQEIDGRLRFVTDDQTALLLRRRPIPGEDATLWTTSNPHETAPSDVLSGRAKWQLHVLFSIYNESISSVSIFDLHSRAYAVTGSEQPPAMRIHRARVGLTQDNSLLSMARTIILVPDEAAAIDLVFEASLFDTVSTTIVFGVYVDYRCLQFGQELSSCLPSDSVYVFQHRADSFDKCRFVAYNDDDISARLAQDPGDKELKGLCKELQANLARHAASAKTSSPPTPHLEPPVEDFPSGDEIGAAVSPRQGQTRTSFEFCELIKSSPTAANLLRVLSFLVPSAPIPRELVAEAHYQLSLALYRAWYAEANIRRTGVRRYVEEADGGDSAAATVPKCLMTEVSTHTSHPSLYWQIYSMRDGYDNRDEAVRVLSERGVLRRINIATLVNIPTDVATKVLANMDELERRVFAECALRALDTLVPTRESGSADKHLFDRLVPHAKLCLERLREFDIWPEAADAFVHGVAEYLLQSGNYSESAIFWRTAVAAAEGLIEEVEADSRIPDWPKTDLRRFGKQVLALDLSYLARTLRLAGNPGAAEPFMLRSVELYEAWGRPDGEKDYLILLYNLALNDWDLGRLDEAKVLFTRVVSQLEGMASDEEFSAVLEDFARLLSSMGATVESEAVLRRAKCGRRASATSATTLSDS